VLADTSSQAGYGITSPLIDVDRGLYELVGIQEVPAFHSEKKNVLRPSSCIFQFRPILVSIFIQVLKIKPSFGPHWFHYLMFPAEE
jgi:hypothetical protein